MKLKNTLFTQFLEKLKMKDNKAFTKLYADNFHKTQNFICSNNGSEREAQDIFQEGIIALWHRLHTEKFVPQNHSQLEAYLFQIVKYKWFDILKKKQLEKPLLYEERSFIEIEEFDLEKEKRITIIEEKLATLKEPCKTILKLFYYKKQSYKTIANQLKYNEKTLKTMKYRCLKNLKKIVNVNNK